MIALCVAAWAVGLGPTLQSPQPPRFEKVWPLPTLPGIMLDRRQNGIGAANALARAKGWQARILWIDGTANMERYNTEFKIESLVAKIADSGFNTIVFDVKSISGQVVYPTQLAPKLQEWKGQTLPLEFDPLSVFVRECKRSHLPLIVSLNAFSEGHQLFKVGPGYERPNWQTTLYEPQIQVRIGAEYITIDTGPGAEASLTTTPPKASFDFAVTIDANGKVVDGFEPAPGKPTITVPTGGSCLAARGDDAMTLRRSAIPGRRLRFESKPRLIPIERRPEQQYPLMTDPTNPEVVARNLAILRDLLDRYAVDGVVYDDRLRYAGANADFGPNFRAAFEKWLKRPVRRWPEDVFEYKIGFDLQRGIVPGPEYENWLIFRAMTLKNYIQRARAEVKRGAPNRLFGIYAGSWYGDYAAFASNYAASDIETGFWYASSAYAQTGFANELDLLMTGCYYPTATIFEAMGKGAPIGATIESAASLSNRLANDETWTYAGIALSQFEKNPVGLQDALQAACGAAQGVMVFDLSHKIDPMWPVFKRAFAKPAIAPHAVPGNRVALSRAKAQNASLRKPAIIISAGTPGAGH